MEVGKGRHKLREKSPYDQLLQTDKNPSTHNTHKVSPDKAYDNDIWEPEHVTANKAFGPQAAELPEILLNSWKMLKAEVFSELVLK